MENQENQENQEKKHKRESGIPEHIREIIKKNTKS